MNTITLSTIGSRGVTVDVATAALPEAGDGGVQLELGLHDGPLILTLTRDEAFALAEEIQGTAGHWSEVEIICEPTAGAALSTDPPPSTIAT